MSAEADVPTEPATSRDSVPRTSTDDFRLLLTVFVASGFALGSVLIANVQQYRTRAWLGRQGALSGPRRRPVRRPRDGPEGGPPPRPPAP